MEVGFPVRGHDEQGIGQPFFHQQLQFPSAGGGGLAEVGTRHKVQEWAPDALLMEAPAQALEDFPLHPLSEIRVREPVEQHEAGPGILTCRVATHGEVRLSRQPRQSFGGSLQLIYDHGFGDGGIGGPVHQHGCRT